MKKKITKTKYKKFERECVEVVKENGIVFFDELYAFVEILPSQFAEWKLNESILIKDEIDINRAKLKRDLRLKWFDSTNATLNAALYKLICTDEEKRSLSSSGGAKSTQHNDICTQEEYLKSLKEMGEGIENAD